MPVLHKQYIKILQKHFWVMSLKEGLHLPSQTTLELFFHKSDIKYGYIDAMIG